MLVATQHSPTVRSGTENQGLPNARQHDAEFATVNPAFAQQRMMAAHRIAKLPATQELMGETFRDTRFPHQPSRRTLVDTIKVLSATGNVRTDQAQWLAKNSGYPNRLWSAIGQLSQTAVNDPSQAIIQGVQTQLVSMMPLRDIASFVSQWARHLPEVIDPQLISQLHAAKRQHQTGKPDDRLNWDALNASLENFIRKIVSHLSNQANRPLTLNGESFDLAPEFGYDIQADGAIIIGADCAEGIVFPYNADDTQPDYWKAFGAGIVLLQRYLFPISTPEDLLDYSGIMFEEIEYDLTAIWNYLAEHNLDDSPDSIEQAIEATEPCMVEDAECFENFACEFHNRQEITENWTLDEPVTIAGFRDSVANLGEPATGKERQMKQWLTDLLEALPESDETAPWWQQFDDNDQVADSHLRFLDEFTPVYGDREHVAEEAAEQQHHFFMQGDDREMPKFHWRTHPEKLLNLAETLRVGSGLVAKLLMDESGENVTIG